MHKYKSKYVTLTAIQKMSIGDIRPKIFVRSIELIIFVPPNGKAR
jgi:hypothetical protein